MNQRLIGIICLTALLWGCQSDHVVYVQESNLGFNVGVSTEGVGRVSIGYDRDVYATVPRKNDTTNDDAMAVFAINKVKLEDINKMKVEEFVATGDPASALANDANAVKALRDKIYGDDND